MHILNLDPNFKSTGVPLNAELMKFPAGERHIKLKHDIDLVTDVLITHRLNNAENIMELLLATDAVRRRFKDVRISAYFPYIPYGRQDRPMIIGEPFSLKIFSNLINAQNYKKVIVLEPHSDVSAAVIDNIEMRPAYYLLDAQDSIKAEFGDFTLIAPDGGALKRIYKHAEFMNYKADVLCATKIRDLNTGKILRTTVDATDEQIKDKVILIEDDICSYGGTFKALAKVLKERGATKVVLVAAHYEGVADEANLGEYIDKVYTTNSINNDQTDFVKKYNVNL